MTPPREHLPSEERRAITVQATIDLAAEQNPSDITTAAIAKKMGLTQGSIFRHFPTKDSIVEAAIEWISGYMVTRVTKAIQTSDTPLAAIEAVFFAHVDFIADHRGVPRIMISELQRPGDSVNKRTIKALMRRYRDRIEVLIEQGKVAGEITTEIGTESASMLYIGAVQGLLVRALITGDVDLVRRDAPGVFAVFRRGLSAR